MCRESIKKVLCPRMWLYLSHHPLHTDLRVLGYWSQMQAASQCTKEPVIPLLITAKPYTTRNGHTRTLMLTHRTTTEHRGQSCACACMQGIGAFRGDFRKEEVEAAASCLTHNLKQIHTVILCSCLCTHKMMVNVHSFQCLPSETDTHKHTGCHACLPCVIYCFQFHGSYDR